MAASSKGVAKKHSKYHPQRPCSNCLLCGKTCLVYSHYKAWSDSEKQFLIRHWKGEPEPDSCICVAHQKEAQRAHPSPKWSKIVRVQQLGKCVCPDCTSTSKLVTPAFAPREEIQAILGIPGDIGSLPLCPKHYQEVYRQFQSSKLCTKCASCKKKPKQGTKFTRHSPNSSLVNQLLSGEPITPTDYICLGCYKAHVAMIKSHEQANELRERIQTWEVVQADSSTDILTKAVIHSVLYVANEFEHERAVLLPDVSQVFLTQYLAASGGAPGNEEHILESPEGSVHFSNKWLLKQLTLYLHPHILSKCVHKKFGTLLYKKGGDILTSLSWALGACKYETKEEPYQLYVKQCNKPDRAKILSEAGDIINDLIHSEMTKHSCHKLKMGMNNFNIDEQISKIYSSLWLFIQSITRTVKQRVGISQQVDEEEILLKKLRCYYIICLLLSCANIQISTAVHILLAETIQSCGGSSKLLKICNQFGIAASSSTHDRFVTEIAEIERTKTLWDSLPRNHFTIASVDNFDMLQSHAAVYCGDQSRSYHGTTLQIVQPNPIPVSGSGSAKRTLVCSPASSPHKLGKVGPKRPRTLDPRNLTQQLQAARCQVVAGSQQQTQPHVQGTVTSEGFQEQPAEVTERKSLESKMLVYTFMKQAFNANLSDSPITNLLREFKDLYAYSTQGVINTSNIYYMELIDEHPDSADTLRCVSDLVLTTASSEVQNGYVVLVGDGKTYQHLMKIKKACI